jgi:hypothetical protein
MSVVLKHCSARAATLTLASQFSPDKERELRRFTLSHEEREFSESRFSNYLPFLGGRVARFALLILAQIVPRG